MSRRLPDSPKLGALDEHLVKEVRERVWHNQRDQEEIAQCERKIAEARARIAERDVYLRIWKPLADARNQEFQRSLIEHRNLVRIQHIRDVRALQESRARTAQAQERERLVGRRARNEEVISDEPEEEE